MNRFQREHRKTIEQGTPQFLSGWHLCTDY